MAADGCTSGHASTCAVGKTGRVDVSGEQGQGARYEPFASFDVWANLRVNEYLWDGFLQRLREASPINSDKLIAPPHRRSLIVAAALNSGAIEGLHGAGRGLTQSVLEHAINWQPVVRQAEGSVAEAFVAASIGGFDMALDIASGAESLSEVWIRNLHAVVCTPQETVRVVATVDGARVAFDRPLEKGAYKTDPNNVEQADGSVHWYCPVDDVPLEMRRLVETLRSAEFVAAHPILQAGFAHYAFVAIHPFQDGNGRVSRVLASIFLLRAASIPLFIYEDERRGYFDALAAADRGDRQRFVDFIERVALDTLGYASDLARSPAPMLTVKQPRERIAKDLQLAADRLDTWVLGEFDRLSDAVEVGHGVTKKWEVLHFGSAGRPDRGRWSPILSAPRLRIESVTSEVGSDRYFRVLAAESVDEPYPLAITVNGQLELELRFEDAHPTVTTRTQTRVTALIERTLRELVDEAQSEIDARGG